MYIDKENLQALSEYLHRKGFIAVAEAVSSAEKAGEGNMNCTLRVFVADKTFIIKQARPYVEKYPTIPAPESRALVEGKYYRLTETNNALNSMMPDLLAVDADNFILVLEDLGRAADASFLYKPEQQMGSIDLQNLCAYLSNLHNNCKNADSDELMSNKALRSLNMQHIFVLPFQNDNGFDLDNIQPGLQELSGEYKNNAVLKARASELGKRYMEDGDTLVHGDFYPGSWLQTNNGIKVIDPEFAHYGKAEFDVGVLKAHLVMSQQQDSIVNSIFTFYAKPAGFDDELFDGFTAMEILRRIIGLAQLPLPLNLAQKSQLLKTALRLLQLHK